MAKKSAKTAPVADREAGVPFMARVPPTVKAKWEKAASHVGLSVSAFVIQAATTAANETIKNI